MSHREMSILYNFTYMRNQKQSKWTKKIKQKEAQRHREQTDVCQRGQWAEGEKGG